MGTLFGFIVGYIVGAKAGSRRFDEVVQSARDVWESREFRALLDALRNHAKDTVDDLNQRFQLGLDTEGGAMQMSDMIEQARQRMTGRNPSDTPE